MLRRIYWPWRELFGSHLRGRQLFCPHDYLQKEYEVAQIFNVVILNQFKYHFETTKPLSIAHEVGYGLIRLLIDLVRAEIDQNSKESKGISSGIN